MTISIQNRQRTLYILLFLILGLEVIENVTAQCSFQYISNDTLYQDYIESIYTRKSADEIITLGTRYKGSISNDSIIFNAPVFQLFDYCGNLLNKIAYKYIGNNKLKHNLFPTDYTFNSEPVGNTQVKINEDELLLVDKALDTLLKKSVMVLFKINVKGELISLKTLDLNSHEMNQTGFKNVIQLLDGRILVILFDYNNEYDFYYFDDKLDFLYKKSVTI